MAEPRLHPPDGCPAAREDARLAVSEVVPADGAEPGSLLGSAENPMQPEQVEGTAIGPSKHKIFTVQRTNPTARATLGEHAGELYTRRAFGTFGRASRVAPALRRFASAGASVRIEPSVRASTMVAPHRLTASETSRKPRPAPVNSYATRTGGPAMTCRRTSLFCSSSRRRSESMRSPMLPTASRSSRNRRGPPSRATNTRPVHGFASTSIAAWKLRQSLGSGSTRAVCGPAAEKEAPESCATSF
jgi:hypothetical protein